jgi:hypothetical protein
MDKLSVFYPHLICIVLLLFYFATMIVWVIISSIAASEIFYQKRALNNVRPKYVWGMTVRTWEKLIYSVISVAASVFIIFSLVPWFFNSYLIGKPDIGWQVKASQANTAIIFGFGYEVDDKGNMTPGASNLFLYNLSKKQHQIQNLILQEGVYVAALRDNIDGKPGHIQLVRMHPLYPNRDVNTFEASEFAITRLVNLGQRRAIVYAHNLQEVRAVADLRRIAATRQEWRDIEFIIPEIPETPFPEGSEQWRTKWKIVYRAIELYYSRVRDAWCY